ncbi:MAG TPA: EAL domain-containing protein [Noviherbaspirillum sp.]|nr:EAL domain-containing protein [Noviherbaspirillum sp.]
MPDPLPPSPPSASPPGLPGEAARALLAQFQGMVYRCRIDSAWTLEFISEGCTRMTGYAPDDFTLRGLITYEGLIHPEDRERVRAQVREALAADGHFSLEYRIICRDGSVRWVGEQGKVIADGHRHPVALQGFVQDITARIESERALREAERRYRGIFENAVEGMYRSTPEQGFLDVNPALARICGYGSVTELLEAVRDIANQLYADPRRRAALIGQLQQFGEVRSFESEIKRRDGSRTWVSENARVVRDACGNRMVIEGTVSDISERREYEARIRHQATHDALTGLPNRMLLLDRLQQAVYAAKRSDTRVAVVFVDLDQFKFVNDSLGHEAGDMLLARMAARLRATVRACDTVSRHGGDSFVLVLTACVSLEAVQVAVRRIMAALAEPLEIGAAEIQVTCSVGISLYPDHESSPDALLRQADSALYKAKEAGRNSYAFFDARTRLDASHRLALLNSLRHALVQQQFRLHYQPRIDLASGALVGAEALIRWLHPSRGMVPPAQFIPVAEDSGMILAIGEWVLRTACAQNKAWQEAGMAPIPVSVNLSPRQLAHEHFVDLVADALAASGLEARYLELEITETLVMRDVEQSRSVFERLKELGVGISIDDFGTGYSSLNYLKRFPVDTLKIDRSFIRDVAVDSDDAGIAMAVISLGRVLQLQVLAEGVETEAQRQFLLENGCHHAQGYLFAHPLEPDEFAARFLVPGPR